MPDRNQKENVDTENSARHRRRTPGGAMEHYRIGMNQNFRRERTAEVGASQTDEGEDVFLPESPDTPSFGPPPGVTDPSEPGPGEPASPGEGPNPVQMPTLPGGTWLPVFPGNGGNTGSDSWPPIAVYPIPILPGTGNGIQQKFCTIRFLYAATGQDPVNISIGNRPVVNQLQYGEISSYFIEAAGVKRIRITDPVKRPILADEIFWFNEGDVYTIALVNGMNGITMFPIPDVTCRRQRRTAACVRAVNLSYNAPSADVLLRPSEVRFEDLRFKAVPPYRQVQEGIQEFYASETMSSAEMFQIEEWLETGRMYTLYLIGDAYGEPEISGLFTEDASGLEGYL